MMARIVVSYVRPFVTNDGIGQLPKKGSEFSRVFITQSLRPVTGFHYYYEEVPAELDANYRRLRVKLPKLKYYRFEQLYDTIVVACVPR
jgi:hypothetical protein